jgi:hypothetical protein
MKDNIPGPHFFGYKGSSYLGSEIVDKDDIPIPNLKAGDKFFIRNCIFGNDEYTALPCHLTPKDHTHKVILTNYGRKLAGIKDDKPMGGLMGRCERNIVIGIEHDPERGWLAMGYSFCPYIPEDL